MVARKVLAGFAMLALGAAIVSPVATASSRCGRKTCSDEVAASGISGQARGACLRQVIADCRAGVCSCTGGSPPCSCVCGDGLCGPSEDCSMCPGDCGPCPTTTITTTPTTTCPPATALYCGGAECFEGGGVGCGSLGLCPQGMTCSGTTCACTGPAIPCGDPRLRGGLCNFCKWGTCPPGMTCRGVPNGACGWDCACQ